MKKTLLSVMALALAGSLSAQVFSEDFESVSTPALPSGWTQVSAATDAGYTTTTDHSSTYFTIPSHTTYVGTNDDVCNCDKSNERLISPAFAVPSGAHVLSFEYILGQYYGEYAELGISTDGGTTYNVEQTLASTNGSGAHIWTAITQDLSAYSGQTINIVFNYEDNAGWGSGLMVDDVSVDALPSVEMEMTSITTATTATAGMVDITGVVTNNGADPISSFDITWDDGTGPYTYTASTGTALNFGDTYNFTHTTQLNVVAGNTYNLTVCVDATSDADATNDCLAHTVSGLTFIPTRNVVIEEGTGTWCGWCPRGAVAMEALYNDASRPNFVGIAVHNGDPMTVTAYDGGAGISGFPGMNVNRKYLGEGVSTAAMESWYDAATAEPTHSEIALPVATVDGSGNINVTVEATFAATLSSEHRLAAVLVEDGVTGTSSGYDQVNYYDGGASGPLSGGGIADWTTAGDPVPAADMTYDHVGRALYGGYAGQASSITLPANAGTSQSYAFTGSAGSYNPNNLKVVGLIIDSSTGEIMNAMESPLAVVGLEENDVVNFMNIYPNPATYNATIAFSLNQTSDVTIRVVNAMGQVVFAQNLQGATGNQNVSLNAQDLANGMYIVQLETEGKSISKKLNINK